VYEQCRDDLLKRQLSNSENFDKAVLSLSTAGLGFSLAFIKDIAIFSPPDYLVMLYLSWGCFGSAIVSTLLSYLASQRGINCQLVRAEQYYLERKDEVLHKTNWWAKATNWLNHISAVVFIIAIFSTIVFVCLNSAWR